MVDNNARMEIWFTRCDAGEHVARDRSGSSFRLVGLASRCSPRVISEGSSRIAGLRSDVRVGSLSVAGETQSWSPPPHLPTLAAPGQIALDAAEWVRAARCGWAPRPMVRRTFRRSRVLALVGLMRAFNARSFSSRTASCRGCGIRRPVSQHALRMMTTTPRWLPASRCCSLIRTDRGVVRVRRVARSRGLGRFPRRDGPLGQTWLRFGCEKCIDAPSDIRGPNGGRATKRARSKIGHH
jgi:hypothetical protein